MKKQLFAEFSANNLSEVNKTISKFKKEKIGVRGSGGNWKQICYHKVDF